MLVKIHIASPSTKINTILFIDWGLFEGQSLTIET